MASSPPTRPDLHLLLCMSAKFKLHHPPVQRRHLHLQTSPPPPSSLRQRLPPTTGRRTFTTSSSAPPSSLHVREEVHRDTPTSSPPLTPSTDHRRPSNRRTSFVGKAPARRFPAGHDGAGGAPPPSSETKPLGDDDDVISHVIGHISPRGPTSKATSAPDANSPSQRQQMPARHSVTDRDGNLTVRHDFRDEASPHRHPLVKNFITPSDENRQVTDISFRQGRQVRHQGSISATSTPQPTPSLMPPYLKPLRTLWMLLKTGQEDHAERFEASRRLKLFGKIKLLKEEAVEVARYKEKDWEQPEDTLAWRNSSKEA